MITLFFSWCFEDPPNSFLNDSLVFSNGTILLVVAEILSESIELCNGTFLANISGSMSFFDAASNSGSSSQFSSSTLDDLQERFLVVPAANAAICRARISGSTWL